jgi:hypothetical protein
MRMNKYLLGFLLVAAGAAADAQDTVRSVFRTEVADASNQEILVLEVNYRQRAADAGSRRGVLRDARGCPYGFQKRE